MIIHSVCMIWVYIGLYIWIYGYINKYIIQLKWIMMNCMVSLKNPYLPSSVICFFEVYVIQCPTHCWWKSSCTSLSQLCIEVYYIPDGCVGFLPSTVCGGFGILWCPHATNHCHVDWCFTRPWNLWNGLRSISWNIYECFPPGCDKKNPFAKLDCLEIVQHLESFINPDL